MLSAWAAVARSMTSRPAGVSTTWMLLRSLGQFSRWTRPASTIRSTKRVTPPVVRATSALSLLMVRRPSGAAAHVDQHVEEDEGDADRLLELTAEAIRQEPMGAHDEAHEPDALVVELAQDPAGPTGFGASCPPSS